MMPSLLPGSPAGSIDATSKPRSASRSAISSGDALTSTKSRTQEISSRIVSDDRQLESTTNVTKVHEVHKAFLEDPSLSLRDLRVFVVNRFHSHRELLQEPQVVLEEQPDVLHL